VYQDLREIPTGSPPTQTWGMKISQFFDQELAISQKWLKIDGYMQRGILQALNLLSSRVTFTAIVPGERPKCALDSNLKCQYYPLECFGNFICQPMHFGEIRYLCNYWSTEWVHFAVLNTVVKAFLCLRPRREGCIIKLAAVSVCPYVCLSVPCLNITRERIGLGSPNLAGLKPIARVNREPI